jgi:exodeoxyribonuclease VII small subunit
MSKTPKKAGFEESLEKLERIVVSLEDEGTTLQKSMLLYEEGITLLEQCADELAEAQGTLQLLRKRADGVFERIATTE